MFESIDELIKSDKTTSRKRFTAGSVSSLILHVLIGSLLVTFTVSKPEFFYGGYKASHSHEDLVEIARVTRLPLPLVPRITPATQNQPRGNADIEREVISSTAKTDADRKGEVSKQLGPQPPSVSGLQSSGPPPSGGPTVKPVPAVVSETAPPPPEKKDEEPPQIDAEKLKGMVRHMAANTQPGTANSGGGGQKGTSVDGGAGVDIGEYKVWIERRIQNIWHRTRSYYSESEWSGRTVVVYFDWHRDGQLVFRFFGKTTGNSTLDNEARNAIQNASPYRPIPKEIKEDVVRLNVIFTY